MKAEDLKMYGRVRSNRDFAGVPAGTTGIIIEASNSWPETESVAIAWNRTPPLTDWFSFDDLQYLDAADVDPNDGTPDDNGEAWAASLGK